MLDTPPETRVGSDMGNGKGIVKINKGMMANEAEWRKKEKATYLIGTIDVSC